MTKKPVDKGKNLLGRAEEKFSPSNSSALQEVSFDETQRLLHELGVHQIELEMQNEELQSQQHYMDFFNLSLDGIVIHELVSATSRGEFLAANQAVCTLLGYTLTEMRTLSPLDIIVPENVANVPAEAENMLTAGVLLHEKTFVGKDGRKIPVEISTRLFEREGRQMVLSIIRDITGRKRAVEKLQASEQKYRQLHESIIDAFAVTDMAGTIQEINNSFEAMVGYTAEELSSLTFWYLTPEKWHDFEADIIRNQVLVRGYSDIFEKEYIRKDGAIIPVELRAFLVRDTFGQPVNMWAIVRDITERKNAELALQKSEQLFRILSENLTVGVAMIGPDLEVVTINNKIREWFCDPDITRHPICCSVFNFPPRSEPCVVCKCPVTETFSDGQVHVSERQASTTNGIRDFRMTSTPVTDQNGKVVFAIKMMEDITERKKVENALRESEEFGRRLIDSSRDCIKVLDLDGRVMAMSSGGQNLFEIDDLAPYLNLPWVEFWKDADMKAAQNAVDRANKGETGIFQGYCETAKGTPKWWEVVVTPIMDASGNIYRLLAVSHDITDMRRIHEELHRAKSAAEEANLAKSFFLANMSHEIRTPVNGVIGMTELLLDTELSGQQRKYAELVRQSGENLVLLISDILDFSKIEAHKIVLEPRNFDLHAEISTIIEITCLSSRNKDLEINLHIEPGVPQQVRGDDGRLRQIINNLLGNAVKFTEKGSISLHISTDNENEQRTTLRFVVRDSGIGISNDKQEDIFKPFTQADGSTTRKFGGTGLGLSICKNLVELMGGEIGVESSDGNGATFWFTIVLEKQRGEQVYSQALVAESALPSVAKVPAQPRARPHRRLLLAEDEPINQMVARTFLDKLGYAYDIVNNGVEAVQALSEKQYDLVLMDCMMPEMGGFEAVARIRSAESNVLDHAIPVIALTAKAVAGDREACLAAGMNDYLRKPLRSIDLTEMLEKWLPDEGSQSDSDSDLHDQLTGDDVVLSLFVTKAPGYVAALRKSLDEGNAPDLQHHAHRLTGAAAAIGAHAFAACAAELEECGQRDEMDKARQKLEYLSKAFEELLSLCTQRS